MFIVDFNINKLKNTSVYNKYTEFLGSTKDFDTVNCLVDLSRKVFS